MSRSTNAVVSMIFASVLIVVGELSAQEVNSDVKIPPPREVVISAPGVTGLLGGQNGTDAVLGQAFQAGVAQSNAGMMTEVQARGQMGDFMVSLLVKAGVITFGSVGAPRGLSDTDAPAGARPAWLGSAPLTPSVAPGRSARRVRATTRPR